MTLPWETLVFLAPLVSAALLLAGIAFGGGEGDGDAAHADADADVGHGHGHGVAHAHDGAQGHVPAPLSFLGIGQVPVGLVVVSLLATFGAAGFVASSLLARAGAPGVGIPVAIGGVAALFGTRWVSRLVARLLPARESYNVRKSDLLGRTARALTEVTATDGFVQLTDHEGNLHQVRARTSGAVIAKGGTLLLVDRDAARDTYLAEPFDPEAPVTGGAPGDRTTTPVAGGRAPAR